MKPVTQLNLSLGIFLSVVASGVLFYLLQPTPLLQRAVPMAHELRCLDELWKSRAGRDEVLDLWFDKDMTRHVHLPAGGCAGPGCSYNKTW